MLALATAVLMAVFAGTSVPDPRADDCPPGTSFNGLGCVNDEPPADEDYGDGDGDGGQSTGCSQDEPLITVAPCTIADFEFNAALDRYLRRLQPAQNELYRPPNGPLSHLGYWTGDPAEGWIHEWRKLEGVADGIQWSDRGYLWLAEAPGEPPVVVVDPEEVAQQIVDGMRFEPLGIGLAPRALEEDPASIGLVGAPVWMWVTNAGPATWGPVEETATVGGVTVTVTAEVESVTWEMGNGGRVTCAGPGVAYEARLGVRASPECGYVYERASGDRPGGAYTVTATANWVATWAASSGASGTFEAARPTTSRQVRIGERQVIETG